MPEDFSDVLTDIAGAASNAVTPLGADAARARAKRRTAHQRLTAAGLAVALVAAACGVTAFAATNHSGGAEPVPPAHSKTATPHTSKSSTPSASASASPSSSPSDTGSSAPAGSTGDYQVVVPDAWTSADELADYWSQYPWQPDTSTPQVLSGTDEQNEYQFAYACMSQTGFQDTVVDAQGMQTVQYSSTAPGEFSGTDTYAMQSMYFYADAQTAATAYSQAQQDLTTCAMGSAYTAGGQPVTWTGTPLAQVGTGFAAEVSIRNSSGSQVEVNGAYSESANYGDELVLAGNVLEIVNLDESLNTSLSDLHTLESGMCVYSGSCPAGTEPVTGVVASDSGTTASPGGSAIQFSVSVTNDFATGLSGVGLVVSLGHCSCSKAAVPVAPTGTLQIWDPASSGWKSIFYDWEGSGMDYVNQQAVPNLDLAPGQTATYKFQLSLAADQTNTVSSGAFDIHASLGYGPGSALLVVPFASMQVTVNPS